MAATTLPRAVRIAVIALVFILWPLAGWTALIWDVRSLILTLTLAAVATCGWGFIYLADKIDTRMAVIRESAQAREAALIGVIEQLSRPGPVTGPQPTVLSVVAS